MTPVVIEVHHADEGYVAGIVTDDEAHELTRTGLNVTREDAIEEARSEMLSGEYEADVKDCGLANCTTCGGHR